MKLLKELSFLMFYGSDNQNLRMLMFTSQKTVKLYILKLQLLLLCRETGIIYVDHILYINSWDFSAWYTSMWLILHCMNRLRFQNVLPF